MEAQLRRIEATKAQAAALQKESPPRRRPVNARQTQAYTGCLARVFAKIFEKSTFGAASCHLQRNFRGAHRFTDFCGSLAFGFVYPVTRWP